MTRNQYYVLEDAYHAHKRNDWSLEIYSRSQRRTARTLVRQELLQDLGGFYFKITGKGIAVFEQRLRDTNEDFARTELARWNAKVRGNHP